MEIRVPAILEIPNKLIPIIDKFNDYRYFLLEGGRGGGKSQAVARLILFLANKYKLRIVCGREIQNSISESVYSLMADLIKQYNLNFEVQSSKIIGRAKESTINFRGFREQGMFNIQGMEGVDLTWIDEAQAITKKTLDVLIPTIRKEQARIFFTMNRHLVDDAVFSQFAIRPDCLHIHINYTENPFCTDALRKEAEVCKERSQPDYEHIWMGIPLDRSEDMLYTYAEIEEAKRVDFRLRDGFGMRIAGFDIARYGDDKCACVCLQQMGALNWETIHIEQWQHRDLAYTTGRILMLTQELELNTAIIDEDGIGAGAFDMLSKGRQDNRFVGFRNIPIGFKDNESYCNPRTENAYKVKEMFMRGHLKITDEELAQELLTLRYTFDNYQRRILVSKDKMRKDGIKSPNLADALIMAASLIGNVKQKQEQQYYRQPQYSQEANLYQLGGIL